MDLQWKESTIKQLFWISKPLWLITEALCLTVCLILLCGLCNLAEPLVGRPGGAGETCHGGAGKEWQPPGSRTLHQGHSATIWHRQSVRDVLLQKRSGSALQTTAGTASLSGNIMFESSLSTESWATVLKWSRKMYCDIFTYQTCMRRRSWVWQLKARACCVFP